MAYKATSDRWLFIIATLMTILGLVMVFSASSIMASSRYGTPGYYFLRQLAFAGAGYVAMILLMNIDYHVWEKEKLLRWLIVGCALALLAVFTQPKSNGAHRWLRYGPLISFQPSEMAKLILVIFVAGFLHRHEGEINQLRDRLLPCLGVVAVFAGLTAIEPDLGQALCMCMILAAMLFLGGLSVKYVSASAILAAPLFYIFVVRVPFRWDRIKAFLDPFQDPLGTGWQITQSLVAVGSGGVFGLGLGASRQKLFFLPEAHRDFIFAIIGEELGLLGTALTVLFFAAFGYRGLRIALKAPDRFGFFLGAGITLMVVLQAFINISMVLAMVPTKGIALPFISQGGSSLLLNLLATGILLNISHYADRT